MAGKERVQELMREIGPLAELLAVQEHEAEATWALMAADESLIVAELSPDERSLVLSGDIGRPTPAERLRWYELFLEYNGQWREHGGLRMALDEPGGTVSLLRDLPVDGLDASSLQAVLRQLTAVLATWREILGRGQVPTDGQEKPEAAFDPRSTDFFIRA